MMIVSRPDISFAVSKAAQSMEKPTKADSLSVQGIVKYLKGTARLGITYGSDEELDVFTDADYAKEPKIHRSNMGKFCRAGGVLPGSTLGAGGGQMIVIFTRGPPTRYSIFDLMLRMTSWLRQTARSDIYCHLYFNTDDDEL